METLFIPTEADIKRWVKEAMQEYMAEHTTAQNNDQSEQDLFNRKEIAKFLRVSLVTLTDWMKRGLPSHKQGGKIYFDKKEVLDYIKDKKMRQCGVGSKLRHLRQEIA